MNKMIITFQINDFLFELFPVEKNNIEQLKDFLVQFYTVGPSEPSVDIADNLVVIKLDTEKIAENNASYKRLVALCEQGQFEKAKPLAQDLISKSLGFSEYHRILGQIHSELGDQDEAI